MNRRQTRAPASDRTMTPEPLAHLAEDGRPHLLSEHLECVGKLAGEFAAAFGSGSAGRLAGLWHDVGKYRGHFQRLIRTENGYEAHIEASGRTERDHSTAGAVLAMERRDLDGTLRSALAFCIAGHHAGLADAAKLRERIDRGKELLDEARRGGLPPEIHASAATEPSWLSVPGQPTARQDAAHSRLRAEMWTRFLFSALCDADFLDTEAFYDEVKSSSRTGWAPLADLVPRLEAHLAQLERTALESEVNAIRREVRVACETAAAQSPGFFSLTVPTGGGKTLAAMSFALAHAQTHGLRRVIVALPFTAIIEQNAAVYRAALGEDAVLEHHSATDSKHESPRARIACENWDAPIVVTTTVQLLESLFANRTSACRKLHRIAGSVVILDEAQTLPPGRLAPILNALSSLVTDYGVSVVVSTATQPAFSSPTLREDVRLTGVRELAPSELRLFERLRRVSVTWPDLSAPATPYDDLAETLAREPSAMAIVHLRKDAQTLTRHIDAALGDTETVHLSALMYPAHRARILADVTRQRRAGAPVRVVATQLVEAGVDLDFPVVYRALAGLDSLAQAAGRCNREGRLERGQLRVFLAETQPPKGVARQAADITRAMLAQAGGALDLDNPETFRRYFEMLYSIRDLDQGAIQEARAKLNFKSVGESFRIIESDWSAPVVIPCPEARALLKQLEFVGASRDRLRALQRYTINVDRRERQRWLDHQLAMEVESVVVLLDDSAYDKRFGLVPNQVGHRDASTLILDSLSEE